MSITEHVPLILIRGFGGLSVEDERRHAYQGIDAGTALNLITTPEDPRRSLWVFRYYDLDERSFNLYGEALVRLIDFVRDLTVIKTGNPKPPVNIIAHSMGGLIVREAVQVTLPGLG